MVYNYTKPRGPIAAMYSSPGPTYSLPGLMGAKDHDPRSVHPKGAAWAFGVRHGKYKDDSSPGPCYLPDPHIFRKGKDGTPQFSIYARTKELASFATPGPGAYCPETVSNTYLKQAPAYSFGSRHRYRTNDTNPGPNVYMPDRMLGKTQRSEKKSAPHYSLTGRCKTGGFSEDLRKTPGPGTYNVTEACNYKRKPPQYSITGRHPMPGDISQKPGPGAHNPDRLNGHIQSAPSYSFGIRHSQYRGGFITEADVGSD